LHRRERTTDNWPTARSAANKNVNSKSFPSHEAHLALLIFISLAGH